MFDLGSVGIWIRGVDEGIEKFHRFPDPEGGSGLFKRFSAGFDIELDSLLGMLLTNRQLPSCPHGRSRDLHVEATRCLVGIEELSESSFIFLLIKSRLIISVFGSVIGPELGDIDIVNEVRDFLEVCTSRI
jgi:hypothetical protein